MRSNRAKGIVLMIVSVVIFTLALYLVIGQIIAASTSKNFEYFGYSLHVVTTDSMSPEYKVGDMIFVKEFDVEDIEIGQDVLFLSTEGDTKGRNVFHRVVNKTIEDGYCYLTTSGTKDGAIVDTQEVTEIIGKATGRNVILGKLYLMLTTPSGLICLIIAIAGVIVVVKCVKKIVKSAKSEKATEPTSENNSDEGNQDNRY